mgnify:CR=1 FL=1
MQIIAPDLKIKEVAQEAASETEGEEVGSTRKDERRGTTRPPEAEAMNRLGLSMCDLLDS